MSHELSRTAASHAKHAVRALAQSFIVDGRQLSAEEVAALADELREIFDSMQDVLHAVERDAPDESTADDVRDTRYCIADAARCFTRSYPTGSIPAPGEQFTRITTTGEIEALGKGRELVVDGAVYRIDVHPNGTKRVCDLDGNEDIGPGLFIHRYGNTERGILLRH